MARGRNAYDRATAKRLLDLISERGVSLSEACRRVGVPRRTVRGWMAAHQDFAAEYDAAQKLRLDALADEVLDIIDTCDGTSQSEVTKARAQADMRRWVLAKALPERFGDRVRQELTGADGEPLIPPERLNPQRVALALLNVIHTAAPGGANNKPLPPQVPLRLVKGDTNE